MGMISGEFGVVVDLLSTGFSFGGGLNDTAGCLSCCAGRCADLLVREFVGYVSPLSLVAVFSGHSAGSPGAARLLTVLDSGTERGGFNTCGLSKFWILSPSVDVQSSPSGW